MTIEMTRDGKRIYRINPDDPCQVDVKENLANARWGFWLVRDSAVQARVALFALEQGREATPPRQEPRP